MSTLEPGIEFRYESVVRALKATADACGRAPSDVKLLAVGKTFDESALLKCAELGQRAFGENYAQELRQSRLVSGEPTGSEARMALYRPASGQ